MIPETASLCVTAKESLLNREAAASLANSVITGDRSQLQGRDCNCLSDGLTGEA